MTRALRPWTIDFHVAQNDATVKGSGSHDKTGRHCLPLDPNGKLDIVKHAGFWLRDDSGAADPRRRAHLLGRLHVPERRHDAAADVERHPARDDRRAQRARVGLSDADGARRSGSAIRDVGSVERPKPEASDAGSCGAGSRSWRAGS